MIKNSMIKNFDREYLNFDSETICKENDPILL